MVKLWDQKIVNLRHELNMDGIQRRLGKMALKEELEVSIRELLDTLKTIQTEVDLLKQTVDIKAQVLTDINLRIDTIHNRQ